MYQQLVGYLLSVAVTQPPRKKLRHTRCRLSAFSVSLRCNIFSVLLQSYLGVRADPVVVFEYDTSLFEFRAETPTLEPLFALPTTTGIPAVPFFYSPTLSESSTVPLGRGRCAVLRRTISILRSLRLLGFGFPIKRPPYHRVSCRSDHRKRGQTRWTCPKTTQRRTSTEPKHRHWSRSTHYQQQQG